MYQRERFHNYFSRKTFSAHLAGPGASLKFEIISFDNQTVLQNQHSGERYLVYNGTVQLNIILSHWRFCGEPNYKCVSADNQPEFGRFLDFHFTLKGSDQLKNLIYVGNPRSTNYMGGPHPSTYDFGGVEATFSKKV